MTGSGSRLREAAGVAAALSRIHRVTVALTRAGFEVARVFGVLGLLRVAAPGGYYRELIVEQTASAAEVAGRVASRRYSVVVIAPASSDTLAKIAHGIADNLASTAANQALKARVPLIVMPGEAPGGVETELPCMVDRGRCTLCMSCIAACPVGAVVVAEGAARIEVERCVGCRRCEEACPVGAVRCFRRVRVEASPLDIENIERLRGLGVLVARDPLDVLRLLSGLGLCVPGSSRL